jgi:hypothetical protein
MCITPVNVETSRRNAMPHFIHKDNFIALRKGCESYLFFYDDEDTDAVIWTMARFAANPDLSFDWHDAATLSRDVAFPAGVDDAGAPDRSPNCQKRF